ncbi:MAG TPA: hypothetical protein PLN53_02555 [Terricaulis sp.]|nr:hypothetical protein [Terricaulis sp.]
MRIAVIVAALALAACEKAPEPTMPPGVTTPDYVMLAAGEGWRFTADPAGEMVLTNADGDTTSAPYVAPARGPAGFRYNGRGLDLDLEWTPCMHDGARYSFRAKVTTRERDTFEGCAAPRWDAYMKGAIIHIDRCLRLSPQTRWVRYFGRDEDSNFILRLSGEGGDVDCHSSWQDDVPGIYVYPRNENLRFIGEDVYVFVRAPGENPGGECYEAPEVRGEDGALLGWVADPEGC